MNSHIRIIALAFTLLLTACGGDNSSCCSLASPNPLPISADDINLSALNLATQTIRLDGSVEHNIYGAALAGGGDLNGDGFEDFAMGSILSSPNNREAAGEVYLVLGNGQINYSLDSAVDSDRYIKILGSGRQQNTGSALAIADVSGDGIADLIIARQNFSMMSKIGAGAVTVVFGSPELSNLASTLGVLDLSSPPDNIDMTTFYGAYELDRLGITIKAGDLDGDGILDLIMGADQANSQVSNSGAVYVIRGGAHLLLDNRVNLADIASSDLRQHMLVVIPPANSAHFHFGSTIEVADLDNNGQAELIVSAALYRASAALLPAGATEGDANALGGSPSGKIYILWDDNFAVDWQGQTIALNASNTGTLSEISGGRIQHYHTHYFGTTVLGGMDYNGDNLADLFVGDAAGDTAHFGGAGLGFVLFNAAELKGLTFDIVNRPTNIGVSALQGAETGVLTGISAMHADIDNDGMADLILGSPYLSSANGAHSGAVHVLWGQRSWPIEINLAHRMQPQKQAFNITNIFGAQGSEEGDFGDALGYSAAQGDLNNDGIVDLILHRPGSNVAGQSMPSPDDNLSSEDRVDVGSAIVINGTLISEAK